MKASTPANSGLHVRYEKGGLILDALPIPQNASAVIVEANVRLPKGPRAKQDFTLAWADGGERFTAELLVPSDAKSPLRVFFRVAVPGGTRRAVLCWREHPLGEIEVPVVELETLLTGVSLEMPSLNVNLGEQSIACRTLVTTQAKGVFASALVRSPHVLASINDDDFRIEVHQRAKPIGVVHVALTDDQLRQRATLVGVALPKLRTIGMYDVSWHLASRCLATQRIRSVSRRTFLRSLRVSATRFQVELKDGACYTVRALPMRDGKLDLDAIAVIQPIFFVTSSEAGIAGLAPLTLRALVDEAITTLALDQECLVTDGLRAIRLGTLPVSELHRVKHFTLAWGDTILGNLPLLPAPTADFTAEGGFAPLDEFLWSPAADEQLKDRLGKLLGGA